MDTTPITNKTTPLSDSTTANETTETQILTIHDVNELKIVDIPNQEPLTQQITSVGMEAREHDIKDFIARHRIVAQGNIAAGGSAGDLIQSLAFPSLLLSDTTIREKVKGFLHLRSNIEVLIIFTAPPTAAGGIRLCTAPDMDPEFLKTRTTTPLQQSQFPNKIYSVSELPAIRMKIPWISQYTHRDLLRNYPDPQHLLAFLVTPISLPVSYLVYAAFSTNDDDFSLTQPTPAKPYFDTFNLTQDEIVYLETYRKGLSDIPKLQNQSLTEAKATQNGLSGIAGTISSAAKTLSKLPVIGSVASTIVPIANFAQGLFSAFGWSKPNNEKPTEPMKIVPATSQVNCDNTHTSHTFGVQALNRVETTHGTYGASTDDMAFEKFLRHPNLISSFSVSTSDPPRKIITSTIVRSVSGSALGVAEPNNTVSVRLTHQQFIANLFQYYYATFVHNYYFFTTQFHSLKVRFVIAPGWFDYTTLPPNIDDSNSIVVNFGANTTHQVKYPAVTNKQFLINPIWHAKENLSTIAPADEDNSFGTLFAIVEVPMQVTSTIVSPTVYGICERFMMDSRFMTMLDQVLVPVQPGEVAPSVKSDDTIVDQDLTPIQPGETTPSVVLTDVPLENQSNTTYASETLPSSSATVETNIVPSHNLDAQHSPNKAYAVCAGEVIVSVKQIISQFTTPQQLPTGTKQIISYYPFYTAYSPLNSAQGDKIDYISSAFAFRKGSANVRYFFVKPRDAPVNFVINSTRLTQLSNSRIVTTPIPEAVSLEKAALRTIPIVTKLEGIADLHVPYYQPFHMVRNAPQVFGETTTKNEPQKISVDFVTTADEKIFVSRAMGDDFSFGYIIGLPEFRMPVYASNTLPIVMD